MTQPRIVIPADEPIQIADSPQLDRLVGLVELQIYSDFPANADDQAKRAAEAEILINSRGNLKWSAGVLERLPRLKMISTCSIGVDAIDVSAATKRGILVCNVPGRTAPIVAEHALALMLGTARRVAFATAEIKAGRWRIPDNLSLRGKLLGVIGAGAIGREMIRLARAIGMRAQAWTFQPSDTRADELGVPFVDLDQLLVTSDVISIHIKLTDRSRGLISTREFQLMKPGALLINSARGAIVDTNALVAALNAGKLAGAGLDVFDVEPLPLDHPLRCCEHVVLTPHSADQNPEGRELLNTGAVDNVLAYLNGHPQNVVN